MGSELSRTFQQKRAAYSGVWREHTVSRKLKKRGCEGKQEAYIEGFIFSDLFLWIYMILFQFLHRGDRWWNLYCCKGGSCCSVENHRGQHTWSWGSSSDDWCKSSSERNVVLAMKRDVTSAKEVIGINGWLMLMGSKEEWEEKNYLRVLIWALEVCNGT